MPRGKSSREQEKELKQQWVHIFAKQILQNGQIPDGSVLEMSRSFGDVDEETSRIEPAQVAIISAGKAHEAKKIYQFTTEKPESASLRIRMPSGRVLYYQPDERNPLPFSLDENLLLGKRFIRGDEGKKIYSYHLDRAQELRDTEGKKYVRMHCSEESDILLLRTQQEKFQDVSPFFSEIIQKKDPAPNAYFIQELPPGIPLSDFLTKDQSKHRDNQITLDDRIEITRQCMALICSLHDGTASDSGKKYRYEGNINLDNFYIDYRECGLMEYSITVHLKNNSDLQNYAESKNPNYFKEDMNALAYTLISTYSPLVQRIRKPHSDEERRFKQCYDFVSQELVESPKLDKVEKFCGLDYPAKRLIEKEIKKQGLTPELKIMQDQIDCIIKELNDLSKPRTLLERFTSQKQDPRQTIQYCQHILYISHFDELKDELEEIRREEVDEKIQILPQKKSPTFVSSLFERKRKIAVEDTFIAVSQEDCERVLTEIIQLSAQNPRKLSAVYQKLDEIRLGLEKRPSLTKSALSYLADGSKVKSNVPTDELSASSDGDSPRRRFSSDENILDTTPHIVERPHPVKLGV